MQVHNFLPSLITCLKQWDKVPGLHAFEDLYYRPMKPWLDQVFNSGPAMHAVLKDLNWEEYRSQTLQLNPEVEETRMRKNLKTVEDFFGFKMQGEILLYGSFATMDGYARFEKGTHCVYMGVDESFAKGNYLDILEVHELSHVARESRPEVWEGWGLSLGMNHDEFVEHQPVVEHLMGEGYSCAISEILVPTQEIWNYVYQEKDGLNNILSHSTSVDQVVHQELKAGKWADWGRLYNPKSYRPHLPIFTHYVWAWQWAKHLIRSRVQGDAQLLVNICSKDLLADALNFQMPKVI